MAAKCLDSHAAKDVYAINIFIRGCAVFLGHQANSAYSGLSIDLTCLFKSANLTFELSSD